MSGRARPSARPERPTRLPLFLEAFDVHEVLGISERTAQRWIVAGKLGAFTSLGGKLRVRRDEFWKAMKGTAPKRKGQS